MNTAALLALGGELAEATRAHISKAVGGLSDRLAALELRLASVKDAVGPPGPPGPVGDRGATGERGETGLQGLEGRPGVDGAVGDRGATGERGETGLQGPEGRPGVDGVAGDRGATGERGETGLQGPEGRPGVDGVAGDRGATGERGETGLQGPEGRPGVDGVAGDRGATGERGADAPPLTREQLMDAVQAMPGVLDACIAKYLTDHPPAAGRDGQAGPAGRDGVGVAGALLDQRGALVVTLSDGTLRDLGIVVGRDGAAGLNGEPGKDGADGVGFDTLQEDLEDGGRTIVHRYTRRETGVVAEFRHQTSVTIYRNVWKDGTTYERGDVVSLAGSIWHANEKTTARPGGADAAARAWTLMVKKGSEGKAGSIGPIGPQGPKGLQGEPGRGHY